jgi:N-6 DNA Methylase
MSAALDVLAAETRRLGYRADAMRNNYAYSDVWETPEAAARSVELAAFTQTPPSYRSAAFGIVEGGTRDPAIVVSEHKGLGAPMLFVIEKETVSVWQVLAGRSPRLMERTTLEEIPALFRANTDKWAPDAIHRAKSLARFDRTYQLDFVDVGLIPAIEGEIHEKLDRLLQEAIPPIPRLRKVEARELFRGVFRLLAAKILMDRNHPRAAQWNTDDVSSVLDGIGDYYRLGSERASSTRTHNALDHAWKVISRALNVANISADDLAYVYENTLVTPEARREFGTHSTPRHVADYIVGRLKLWEYGISPPKVFEPFTGAGVFLVSALKYMSDGLPHAWTDQQRHQLLVRHIRGAEIDTFGCEVAKLSLILADYPNANGWKIEEADLFLNSALQKSMQAAEVILCNPPFESFTATERKLYPEASSVGRSKAVVALDTAIKARPIALGFVVPRTLLVDKSYHAQRAEIEKHYGEVELVSLPDRVFNVSKSESALLIARDRRELVSRRIVRSSEVDDSDLDTFRLTGKVSRTREITTSATSSDGSSLWISRLQPVWSYLEENPKIDTMLRGHWGIRWNGDQSSRVRNRATRGFSPGLFSADDLNQFVPGVPRWLETTPDSIYGAGDLPWDQPKILCNAIRKSRKTWRFAAAVDRSGLLASQQFICLWPVAGKDAVDLDALLAVLNGPLANAFLTERSFDKRFRITTVEALPLPKALPENLGHAVRTYVNACKSNLASQNDLADMLDEVDALTMAAYDLPPRMERALLAAFADAGRRPLMHNWKAWGITETDPCISLLERRSQILSAARNDWVRHELKPFSDEEESAIRDYWP